MLVALNGLDLYIWKVIKMPKRREIGASGEIFKFLSLEIKTMRSVDRGQSARSRHLPSLPPSTPFALCFKLFNGINWGEGGGGPDPWAGLTSHTHTHVET